jgi:hypothetical protein
MTEFEVKIKVKAQNFAKASLMAEGVQNVINELGEHNQALLVELADETTTKKYAADVMKWINNPMLRRIIGV